MIFRRYRYNKPQHKRINSVCNIILINMHAVGRRDNAVRSVIFENFKGNLLIHIAVYNNHETVVKVIEIGHSNGQVPWKRLLDTQCHQLASSTCDSGSGQSKLVLPSLAAVFPGESGSENSPSGLPPTAPEPNFCFWN